MAAVDNYRRLKEEIVDTATACRRKPEEITLLVISKNQPWEKMVPVYKEGCRDFGENRLQETLSKIEISPP